MVYIKKADREKAAGNTNRRSPVLKTIDAAHTADKNSRTLLKAKFLCELLRSKTITEEEKDIVRRRLDKLKKRINRRLTKLTAWGDTSPEDRIFDLRPSNVGKSGHKDTMKALQAYMTAATQKHHVMMQQQKQQNNTSNSISNNIINNNSSSISSGSNSNSNSNSSSTSNMTNNSSSSVPAVNTNINRGPDQGVQLREQQNLLQRQAMVMQQHKPQDSLAPKHDETQSSSSYDIQSLIETQQLNSANAIKSLKEDL